MRISHWSSDVCSSDLARSHIRTHLAEETRPLWERACSRLAAAHPTPWQLNEQGPLSEIGRASCRERVGQYVQISGVAVSLKQKSSKSRKALDNAELFELV